MSESGTAVAPKKGSVRFCCSTLRDASVAHRSNRPTANGADEKTGNLNE
jgi:hypothetical protein